MTATEQTTELRRRIESGKSLLLAEMSPPCASDPGPVRETARRFAGKVHSLGISDNRRRVCMSALAAASLVASEGVEPILHVVTRDRNRVALVSEYLGAQALGIGNLLCTSGTHQTLGRFRAAKNVFDVDPVQLLETLAGLARDASILGEESIDGAGQVCLGAAVDPAADPIEMQALRAAKKVAAGAAFLITAPVFDLERFDAWLEAILSRGLDEKAAIVVGIRPLGDAEAAAQFARQRPAPGVPDALLERIAAKDGAGAQREAAIEIAVETIGRLRERSGLRGFAVAVSDDGDVEAALAIIERSGLGTD